MLLLSPSNRDLIPARGYKFIYLGLNVTRSHYADLSENDLTIPIHHKQCRHGTHTKTRGGLPPYRAHQVEPDHRGLTSQLSLQPIHDRFCQQAGTSKVGIELNHCRLVGAQDLV